MKCDTLSKRKNKFEPNRTSSQLPAPGPARGPSTSSQDHHNEVTNYIRTGKRYQDGIKTSGYQDETEAGGRWPTKTRRGNGTIRNGKEQYNVHQDGDKNSISLYQIRLRFRAYPQLGGWQIGF